MDRCVQGRSAEEPKSMLLICSRTYFVFRCFSSLAYHRARRFGVWTWEPVRAHTRLDFFLEYLGQQGRGPVWSGPKERLVNSLILIAVSPLRDFL